MKIKLASSREKDYLANELIILVEFINVEKNVISK